MKKRSREKEPILEELAIWSGRTALHKRHPITRRFPKWVLDRWLRYKQKDFVADLEIDEYGEPQEKRTFRWRRAFVVFLWIVLIPVVVSLIYSIYKIPQLLVADYALTLTNNEWLQRVNEARSTLVQAIGGLILLIGVFFTWRNIRSTEKNLIISQKATAKNLEIAEEGLVTQRFSKAIELLGSDKIEVRLGGIYALERIARESRKDHWPVMEILTGFVRENAAWKRGDPPAQIRTDIQAVLTVLGRRNKAYERIGMQRSFRESRRLDLHGTNLQGADLFGADLSYANLADVDLSNSSMLNTNLEHANLDSADLSESDIRDSQFEGTELSGTQFRGARLFGIKLPWPEYISSQHQQQPTSFEGATLTACSLRNRFFQRANFKNATFFGGRLDGADLKGADFADAKFDLINLKAVDFREAVGLTLEQIKKDGVDYEESNLPANIRESLPVGAEACKSPAGARGDEGVAEAERRDAEMDAEVSQGVSLAQFDHQIQNRRR